MKSLDISGNLINIDLHTCDPSMMWILSEDFLELFRNVPFPCWIFLSLLCVGAQLSGVSGVHDFKIYRMQQFDLHGTRLG